MDDCKECRVCGKNTRADEIKVQLQDQIKGEHTSSSIFKIIFNFFKHFLEFITFKEFFEYYCRVELDKDESLPQGICNICHNTVLSFCLFAVNVENQQNKFKNRLPKSDSLINKSQSVVVEEKQPEKRSVGPARRMRKKRNGLIHRRGIRALQRDPDKRDKPETVIKKLYCITV
jgi:rRNA maturation protein Rpf1